jgi:hypothetical protein
MWCIYALVIAYAQADPLQPEQVKLAWTENEKEMRVSWVTYQPSSSYVKFKATACAQAGEFIQIAGESKRFNEGALFAPSYQYIHTAVMQGIEASCTYQYSVGNDQFWSSLYSFSGRTPDYSAPFEDANNPAHLIFFGDLGVGKNGNWTKTMLYQEQGVDAIVHIGDFAYDLHEKNGQRGDEFLRMMEPVASRIPYMTIPGNHEDHMNCTHYRHRFQMPNNGVNKGSGFFYSFNVGPVHVVLFNTEIMLNVLYPIEVYAQMEWLVKDLAQANQERDIRPWIIAGSHHPLYCSVDWTASFLDNFDCGVTTLLLRKMLEDIFHEYQVDLYLQGHVHNYERDSAIYHNKTVPSDFDSKHLMVNPKATIYITTGNGGNSEGLNDLISTTPQLWARALNQDYGYGRVKAYNQTHLYWEQVSAVKQKVIDYLWVVKQE